MLNMIVNGRFQESLHQLDPESVQLCFTSPPYENMIVYRDGAGKPIAGKSQSSAFIDEFWYTLFNCLESVMKKTGVVAIVINDKQQDGVKSTTNYEGMLQVTKMGWYLIDEVPWIKTASTPRDTIRFQDWWEHIWLFSRSKRPKFYPDRIRGKYSQASIDRYAWGGGLVRKIGHSAQRNLSRGEKTVFATDDTERKQNKIVSIDVSKGKLLPNVLIISPDCGRNEKHPARFPLNLPRWGITLCTDPDDLVIDPMCGSGTTLISAKEMGREYWGSDIGDSYVKMSLRVLERTVPGQLSIFGEEFQVPTPAIAHAPDFNEAVQAVLNL